ncbi:hypothetical protein TRIUR3_32099 [Triticum urartu]|uniref:Uncharacterized protein n=2 Tax=Triticum TaxID=4564 RepID=A0A9R0Y7H0_TRITD|nr:hypothetical protein TRIUR3_32099 [Triticum urartu]VAI49661.1 unnamed protein product [Triticum turgidum subsp. durum]
MATIALIVAMVLSLAQLSAGSRRLMELYVPPESDRLTYHQGGVLGGDIPVSILWYGKFTPAQRSIVADFVVSLNSAPNGAATPSGPKGASLEACTACPGVYGSGAYPGYAGNLLVDPATGASYNANGANGRKYLLPALYDPATASCNTLV